MISKFIYITNILKRSATALPFCQSFGQGLLSLKNKIFRGQDRKTAVCNRTAREQLVLQ